MAPRCRKQAISSAQAQAFPGQPCAQAGIQEPPRGQERPPWVPASAGMTCMRRARLRSRNLCGAHFFTPWRAATLSQNLAIAAISFTILWDGYAIAIGAPVLAHS